MIRIHFDRRTNAASHAGFDGFGGNFTASGSDPYFTVARLMTDAGMPDAPATFYDERGMACMTVQSIHSCARRYRPTPDEAQARSERVKVKAKAWRVGMFG